MNRVGQILCCVLLASSATAGSDGNQSKCPPSSFPIRSVEIQVLWGGGLGRERHTVTVLGTGHGRVEHTSGSREPETQEFTMTDKDIVDLVNRFYAAYFFDLAESYGEPHVAVLERDGVVATQNILVSDGPGTTVILRLGDCTKRAAFGLTAPPELYGLAQYLKEYRGAHTGSR
jgi:hypothetical protein